MRHYRRLSQEKRYRISALKQLGYTQRQIAQEAGQSPSTISRELKRSQGIGAYPAETVQRRLSDRWRQEARKYHKRIPEAKRRLAVGAGTGYSNRRGTR